MHEITNAIATIRYKSASDMIVVNFNKGGDEIHYHETLALAEQTAIKHDTNNCLLIKKDFSDVNTDHFLLLIKDWYHQSSYISSKCEIAILTKKQAFEKLMKKYAWLKKANKELALRIFQYTKSAYLFFSLHREKRQPAVVKPACA